PTRRDVRLTHEIPTQKKRVVTTRDGPPPTFHPPGWAEQAPRETYTAGKDDEARVLCPVPRMSWERIETGAESFGDLDPKLDLREADLEPDQKWTGWHRIEKDLWAAGAQNYQAVRQAARGASLSAPVQ